MQSVMTRTQETQSLQNERTLTQAQQNMLFQGEEKTNWQLTVKFSVSNTPLLMEEGTHKMCLERASKIVKFLEAEHAIHRTGISFKVTPMGTDTFMVHSIKTPTHPKASDRVGLYMVMNIRQKTERSDYDDIPGPTERLVRGEGINAGRRYLDIP